MDGESLTGRAGVASGIVPCILLIALLSFTTSCSNTDTVYVSDRHGDSFYTVLDSSQKDPLTLILLDYHHDMGPGPVEREHGFIEESITSYNWVGGLVLSKAVEKVYWVSGYDLQLPNINSRRDWLARKLSADSPDNATSKVETVEIVDWFRMKEIWKEGIDGPVAVSLDLDILTVDPGEDPDEFLEEMLALITEINPSSITVALSAICQPDPSKAWKWLGRCIEMLGNNYAIELLPTETDPVPESREEKRRWQEWRESRKHTDFGSYFAPGIDLWNWAPAAFWDRMAKARIASPDTALADLIQCLDSALGNRSTLEKRFPREALLNLCESAAEAAYSAIKDPPKNEPVYYAADVDTGLGVRFIDGTDDRGCLVFYRGVGDVDKACRIAAVGAALFDYRYDPLQMEEYSTTDIELSIFGRFTKIENSLDFIPGFDSLLMEHNGSRTLLQASLAVERNLSRIQFIETLCRKAGVPKSSWKEPGIVLYKAPTTSIRLPLSDINQNRKVKK